MVGGAGPGGAVSAGERHLLLLAHLLQPQPFQRAGAARHRQGEEEEETKSRLLLLLSLIAWLAGCQVYSDPAFTAFIGSAPVAGFAMRAHQEGKPVAFSARFVDIANLPVGR